ncbi:unnamed protein product [Callosobruchus maculatus]|uniref:Large ribosomal subunit protein uL10m n=1 Tax=Callosobruchus maculatus TaxID=64391 RepID=A0A653CEP1_CALMS|nr:unnamed protein product [Callosobruchus maculatus]VEN45824.1 unnamed protein product [Callosobruchus maculatus]VEN45825.1 unnamed protein product [Callosobruchus maculatus]
MALVSRKVLLETVTPIIQVKRFRGKVNLSRPRAPHFEKALFLELTKPWYLSNKKDKKPFELCKGFKQEKAKTQDNPFQRFIAQELHGWFTSSRLIGFYHHNPMNADDEFKAFCLFKKENMHFKKYGKKTLEMAVKETPYEAVLDFYVSQNMTVFSPEPDIKKMLKISKKFPQLVLLAAVYEGQFISKDDLMKYSMIPNIQTAQAQLVSTLNSLGSNIVTQLNTHQTTLVQNLEERSKQLQDEK